MKKALAMALGAMLVAGSAAPAAAASQIDFSGYYRAYFLNDWNYNSGDSEVIGKQNDSRFTNRLNLDFGFHATDEVSVYWRLRAPASQRWGDVANQGGKWGERSAAETVYVYGEVVQDWGTVSIGRLSSNFGNLGLADLGYAPTLIDPSFTLMDPFDFDNHEMDGIRWANRWDNGFQLVAQFNRLLSEKGIIWEDEQTSDLYTVEGAYFWDGGGASLALNYLRDHVSIFKPLGDQNLVGSDIGALRMFYINPAIAHSWDNGFSLHFEGKLGFGKVDSEDTDNDVRGYAFYLDGDYNYGPGNVTLAGWWASGTGADDDKINSGVDFGDFKPLLIAYGGSATHGNRGGVINAVAEANARSGGDNVLTPNANHWAIDLTGRHAFTDDITLTWALAYLALNKTTPGASKSIGFETDLGLQFQLLDNLKFTTDVGYLFAGKALDILDEDDNRVRAKDRVAWYNTLTFSF